MNLLKDLLGQFLQAVPNVVGALVLLVLGWIISKIIYGIVRRVLVAIKIDALGDKLNEIEFIEKSPMRIVFSTFLAKVLYYMLLLIFFIAAADVLGLAVVSQLISDLIAYIPKLISALILMVFGLLVANFIKNIISTACSSLQIPGGKVLSAFVFYFLLINVMLSALKQAEVNIDFLSSNLTLILAGIVLAFAIGYGFASRTMMANLLASLYSRGKFKVGDVIKVGEIKGQIAQIDSSSITINTQESDIIIPLSKLASDQVERFR